LLLIDRMDEFDVLGEQENVSPNELAGGEQGEEMVGPYGSVDMMEGGIGLNMDENEMG